MLLQLRGDGVEEDVVQRAAGAAHGAAHGEPQLRRSVPSCEPSEVLPHREEKTEKPGTPSTTTRTLR